MNTEAFVASVLPCHYPLRHSPLAPAPLHRLLILLFGEFKKTFTHILILLRYFLPLVIPWHASLSRYSSCIYPFHLPTWFDAPDSHASSRPHSLAVIYSLSPFPLLPCSPPHPHTLTLVCRVSPPPLPYFPFPPLDPHPI